jgi:hypothetical protein
VTPAQQDYYRDTVQPLETALLGIALGQLFTGLLFDEEDDPVTGLVLPDLGVGGLRLNSTEVGRLFMAPDYSQLTFRELAERNDGTPAGLHVYSINDFVQEDEQIDVVAYRDRSGDGLWIDSLRLARVMLAEDAPELLCTVAFGLMACTAFRFGFAEVTLFAAGRGYADIALDDDDLVGYHVWPKFGFDSPLVPADLNRDPRFAQCASVQDILAIDVDWWRRYGRPMEMRFDLSPHSRSWGVLLNYMNSKFHEEWQ